MAESLTVLQPNGDDFDLAKQYLRHYETGLRAGDALHLAIAVRNRVDAICSLDKALLTAGRALGLPVGTRVRLAGYRF